MLNKYNLGDQVRTKIHDESDSRTEVDATICGVEISPILINHPNTKHLRYKIAYNPSPEYIVGGCTCCNGYVDEEDIIGRITDLNSNVSESPKDTKDLYLYELTRMFKINIDIDIHCCDKDFTIPHASDAGFERCPYGYHIRHEADRLSYTIMYLVMVITTCTNQSDPILSELRKMFISFSKEIVTAISTANDCSSVLVTIDNGKLDGTTLQASFCGCSDDNS